MTNPVKLAAGMAALTACVCFAAGCGKSSGTAVNSTAVSSPGSAAPAASGQNGQPGAMPAAGSGMNAPYAAAMNEPVSGKDPQVDSLKSAAAVLQKDAKAHPSDKAVRNKAADALYQAGYASMMSPNLDRKLKYRQALEYYRQALALNPQHADAKQNKEMIEQIYRSMGRPVPK